MADNIKDKAKETAAAAGKAAGEAKESVKETASNLADRAREMAGGAAERADDTLSSVGQGMSSLAGTLRERAPHEGMVGSAAGAVAGGLEAGGRYLQEHGIADMGEDLRGFIRQHPISSVLAVLGLGFLLGCGMRR